VNLYNYTALAEQHHLDALALHRWEFPHSAVFQFPNLLLAALDHPSPESESNHIDPLTSGKKFP
jgi:hypothetical protein